MNLGYPGHGENAMNSGGIPITMTDIKNQEKENKIILMGWETEERKRLHWNLQKSLGNQLNIVCVLTWVRPPTLPTVHNIFLSYTIFLSSKGNTGACLGESTPLMTISAAGWSLLLIPYLLLIQPLRIRKKKVWIYMLLTKATITQTICNGLTATLDCLYTQPHLSAGLGPPQRRERLD